MITVLVLLAMLTIKDLSAKSFGSAAYDVINNL
jgi:hypothetical protein